MSDPVRHKGRFIKKKVLEQKIKIANALQSKRLKGSATNVNSNSCEGIRMVDLKCLGENLKCDQCKDVLSLDDIVGEQHLGLYSLLKVKCLKCDMITTVPTSKTHAATHNNAKHSDINTAIVLGKFKIFMIYLYFFILNKF